MCGSPCDTHACEKALSLISTYVEQQMHYEGTTVRRDIYQTYLAHFYWANEILKIALVQRCSPQHQGLGLQAPHSQQITSWS